MNPHVCRRATGPSLHASATPDRRIAADGCAQVRPSPLPMGSLAINDGWVRPRILAYPRTPEPIGRTTDRFRTRPGVERTPTPSVCVTAGRIGSRPRRGRRPRRSASHLAAVAGPGPAAAPSAPKTEGTALHTDQKAKIILPCPRKGNRKVRVFRVPRRSQRPPDRPPCAADLVEPVTPRPGGLCLSASFRRRRPSARVQTAEGMPAGGSSTLLRRPDSAGLTVSALKVSVPRGGAGVPGWRGRADQADERAGFWVA